VGSGDVATAERRAARVRGAEVVVVAVLDPAEERAAVTALRGPRRVARLRILDRAVAADRARVEARRGHARRRTGRTRVEDGGRHHARGDDGRLAAREDE